MHDFNGNIAIITTFSQKTTIFTHGTIPQSRHVVAADFDSWFDGQSKAKLEENRK